MNDYGPKVRRLLKDAGFSHLRWGAGSHEIYSDGEKNITVPVRIKVRHTANGILKEAGLKKAF